MILKVTKKNIQEGIPDNCMECAVAKALKKQFPEQDVRVYHDEIKVGSNTFRTTKRIDDFITAFDKNKKSVKPDSFRLLQKV